MRVLIALSVILVVGYAAPQYGYVQPSDIINGGGGGRGISPNQGNGGGEKYLPPGTTTQAPLINKKFYIISPPEEELNPVPKQKHIVLGRPQRNYRVLFIRAPAPDSDGVKYSAEFAPQEEKTVIYVLSKKGEDLDADQIATVPPTQASKPEVFFIKYKSDEEAEQAQKEIQNEYDKLGGTNEVIEDRPAPVTSVIGSLDGLNPDGSYNYRQVNRGNGAGGAENLSTPQQQLRENNRYLPSFLRH